MWWTSKAGTIVLEICFGKVKRRFLVPVDMANILLYIEKERVRLKTLVLENGYSVDEVEGLLQILIDSKVIQSERDGNDYQLSLMNEYE